MQTLTSEPLALDPLVFSFGGVRFDVHPSPELRWELGDEHRLFRSTEAVPLTVHLNVEAAPELTEEMGRQVAWEWEGARGRVWTAAAVADLRDLGNGRFAARAHVSPDVRGCSNLCTALAAALAFRAGGLVLHASGVEVDGEGVLFVGPSGAGKTTAANHCPGATWFARDRAAVIPTNSGWVVAPLCGGDPIELPRSTRRTLPLRAIVRVKRGEAAHQLDRLPAARALFHLRESIQSSPLDAAAESAAVDRALQLQSDVLVGQLRSVLGSGLLEPLRSWLREEALR